MQLDVKVFANLRDKANPKTRIGEPIKLEITDNETIREILEKINLKAEDIGIAMINGVHQSLDYQIKDEDKTLSLFSPSGGG